MKETMNEAYYNWLIRKIGGKRSFSKLLRTLHERPFSYIIDMDGNRECDGIDLRYHFGEEKGMDQRDIARMLDATPCSFLEMMVALFLRIEEHILNDPELGDQTEFLFWESIVSLGLHTSSDDFFDEGYVHHVLDILTNRKYKADGTGGMFTIPGSKRDLRQADIWYQAMWYLDYIFNHKEER